MRPVVLSVFFVLVGGCSQSSSNRSAGDAGVPLEVIASLDGSPLDVSRRVLFEDVVEYQALLRVGTGEHDVIGLHRVTREREPWSPVPTSHAIFLVHGVAESFRTAFAFGPDSSLPDDHSLAVFLARSDIDVWGIDLRWALVPAEVTPDPLHPNPDDFSFMRDWNTGTHVEDIRLALDTARTTRERAGRGSAPLSLLGFSVGAYYGYALVNLESQRPPGDRDVSGFIPVDMAFKAGDEETRLSECTAYEQDRTAVETSGLSVGNNGYRLRQAALAARDAPDDPSVYGVPNHLVGLITFSGPFLAAQLLGQPVTPFHDHAGAFQPVEGGLLPWVPSGFVFTDEAVVWEAAIAGAPFSSHGEWLEFEAIRCDDPSIADVPWDDHLSEIDIPIFYVGAAGGWGAEGLATTKLLASQDNTSLVIEQMDALPDNSSCPPAAFPYVREACSYGHTDLLFARNAPERVWTPIRDWVMRH